MWQAAYAELYFCDLYWPDFGPDAFDEALAEYARRSRRLRPLTTRPMRERGLGAAILVPVVAAAFLLGQPWLTLGVAALAALAGLEAARLLRRGATWTVEAWIVVAGPPLAVLGILLAKPPIGIAETYLVVVIVIAAIAAFRVTEPFARLRRRGWPRRSAPLYVGMLAFVPGIISVAPAVPPNAPSAAVLDSAAACGCCSRS